MALATVADRLACRTTPLHLWLGRDRVVTWSADALRGAASRWAGALQAHGVQRGAVVATSAPTSLELVAALLGAWQCGAAVAVLPELSLGAEAALRRVADGLQHIAPSVLLVDGDLPAELAVLVPCVLPLKLPPIDAPSQHSADHTAQLDDLALMQLTSGSTGRAKVVPVTHRMLAANCEATAQRMQVVFNDHVLSWLPLTHDMGFSGALAQCVSSDLELTLLPTALFAQSPLHLLQAMSDQRATLSPNPPSAYELLARLGRRAQREQLDLSHWRFAWVGAEPVFAHVLRAFEQALQPLGLRAGVLQPAYGMAEAVVAVSFAPAGQPWRSLRVQAQALREQGVVLPVDTEAEAASLEVIELVSNGAPLQEIHVQVRDEAGQPLPPGRQGTLWVQGPSVSNRYLQGEEPHRFAESWYDTGDQGFLWDGEVYVTGRVKDIVARGGLKVGAHEIELAVEAELDLRPGRVAAFPLLDHAHGRERLVVVVARRFGGDEPALERRLGDAVLRRCGLRPDVVTFAAGVPLPRTTSGKLQRSEVRARWLRGDYAAAPAPDSCSENNDAQLV